MDEQLERDAKINLNIYLKEKQYNLLQFSKQLLENGSFLWFPLNTMSMFMFSLQQSNKMLSSTKTFSKSLKKFTSKANPQHRQVSLYFARNNSSPKQNPTHLPTLTPSQNAINRRTRSQKIKTQPAQEYEWGRQRQPSLSDRVDDIVLGLVQRGEATMQQGKDKKKLKNLRIVTEQSQQRCHKRSPAYQQVEMLALNKEISRERLLRRKFLLENPQIQKKVSTRWDKKPTKGPNKELLSYYPLVDLRQQNQEILLNMPLKSQDYMRKLRQTALHKLKH